MNNSVAGQSWHAFKLAEVKRHETILLLASEVVIRKVIREALESKGYFVVMANDLSGALEWLKDSTPHLLIVRHHLDNVSGHDAAMYLRSTRPGLPVLIVGGIIDDPGLQNREIQHGFEVFPKPFKAAELLDKVKEMLLKYSLRDSTQPVAGH